MFLPTCTGNSSADGSVFAEEESDAFVRYLLVVYPVLFLLVGVPADVLSTVIWARRVKDSQGSTSLYLTALCAVDTLVLTLGCLRHLLMTVACLDLHLALDCKVPMFLYTWLSTVSVWIICLMCIERLVCVIWPFDMKIVCRARNGLVSLATVAALCACANLYIPIIIGRTAGGSCDALPRFEHLRSHFNTLDSVVYSYLPFALIVALNAVIVGRLSKRSRDLGRSGGGGRHGGARRSSNKIFFTVFCMALCHLLFTAPIVVWHIRVSEWCNYDTRPVTCARLEIVWKILEKLNHLTHFFIFCLTSPVFQADLRAITGSVCCLWARPAQPAGNRKFQRADNSVARCQQGQLLPDCGSSRAPNPEVQQASVLASLSGNADPQLQDHGFV